MNFKPKKYISGENATEINVSEPNLILAISQIRLVLGELLKTHSDILAYIRLTGGKRNTKYKIEIMAAVESLGTLPIKEIELERAGFDSNLILNVVEEGKEENVRRESLLKIIQKNMESLIKLSPDAILIQVCRNRVFFIFNMKKWG